jgi:hypothetical protein
MSGRNKDHRDDTVLKLANRLFKKYGVVGNPKADKLFDLIYSRLEGMGFEGDKQMVEDEFADFVGLILPD